MPDERRLEDVEVRLNEGSWRDRRDAYAVAEIVTQISRAIYRAAAGVDYHQSLRFDFIRTPDVLTQRQQQQQQQQQQRQQQSSELDRLVDQALRTGLDEAVMLSPADFRISTGSVVGRGQIASWFALMVLGALISKAVEKSELGNGLANVGAAAIDAVTDTAIEIGQEALKILQTDGEVFVEDETLHVILPRRPRVTRAGPSEKRE